VSPVRYELDFYIPEDIFHSHCREDLKSDMIVSHRKHTYRPPRPVTGIVLLLYMQMMFEPHRKHTYA
jgi:hypothetical protein